MAEAYAALVSILQILDQLKNHPRPPISLDKHQVQSITQIVTFLQDFLQIHNNHDDYSKQVDDIADAAHAVEDVIESHIVDRILAEGEEISSVDFYEALQKVIDYMEMVKREIMDLKVKIGVDSSTSASASVASSSSASVGQNQTMVGFDDILQEVLDKLTSHKSSRQIISITGCFDEDDEILIMFVIAMWVSEGFVRPIYGKSLEETAKEYVTELIDRNLLLINKDDISLPDVRYKLCKIHDLLRDLCLRESVKQKFFNVVGDRSLKISHNIRRIYITNKTPENKILPILESSSLVRSLWWEPVEGISLPSNSFRLLRVALVKRINYVEDIVRKVNMRIMAIEFTNQCRIPSSFSCFWNLQTIAIANESLDLVVGPFQIWNLPQLRIVLATRLSLLDPPSGENERADCSVVLENLHTLATLHNFKCSEEVVKRIPHIKILEIGYEEVEGSSLADYCLNNLDRLPELEHLVIKINMQSQTVQNLTITFSLSLKFLELSGTALYWDDLTTKIGSLPLLQHLELNQDSCVGTKWETVEGQFCRLESLTISGCGDNLEYWMTENTHFPRLKSLILEGLHKLYEIPLSIGDIPTLQSIKVEDCCDSVCDSAERIKCEQEELGNEDLQVQVYRM